MEKDNVLITICGRAGSKGCKNKNIKDFLGAPLVYYTLAAAFDFAGRVDADVDVCLNTDSPELRDIVLKKYPEVNYIERSKELGEDHVPKPEVWHNSIDVMQERKGKKYQHMIDLDITSPLRQIDDIMNAYKLKLSRPDADMVESVTECRRNPYFNMLKQGEVYATTVIDSNFATRQEAPVVYDENASIYVVNTDYFDGNTENTMYAAKTIVYIMKDTAVLDIDSEEDFKMMEFIGKYLYENEDGYKKVRELIRK